MPFFLNKDHIHFTLVLVHTKVVNVVGNDYGFLLFEIMCGSKIQSACIAIFLRETKSRQKKKYIAELTK